MDVVPYDALPGDPRQFLDVKPVLTPFFGVASYIMQAKRVRLEAHYRHRVRICDSSAQLGSSKRYSGSGWIGGWISPCSSERRSFHPL